MHPEPRLRPIRTAHAAALALAAFACVATPARAGVELGIGADQAIEGHSTSVLALDFVTGQDRHPWEFAVGRFGAHHPTGNLDYAPATWYLAVSRRIQWGHVFVSGGIAYDTADDDVLSGHWQFATGIGVRIDRWTVSLHHLSNAGLVGHNHGETFGLVSFAF